MTIDPKKNDERNQGKDKKPASDQAGSANDDCRCKEASRMSPRQLLKLMINDLALWKKTDKE